MVYGLVRDGSELAEHVGPHVFFYSPTPRLVLNAPDPRLRRLDGSLWISPPRRAERRRPHRQLRSPMEEPSSSSASTSKAVDTSQGLAAELLAGGFGGAVGVFVGQPLDFVKVCSSRSSFASHLTPDISCAGLARTGTATVTHGCGAEL